MSDSWIQSRRRCTVCQKTRNEMLEIGGIEDAMELTSIQGKIDENGQSSDTICPKCIVKSENSKENVHLSLAQETPSSSKNPKLSSIWDTIIVTNNIPITIITPEKLISPSSQNGGIKDTYLYERVDELGPNAHKPERVAQLTFTSESDAWKVLEASQSKSIKYNNEVLIITVDWDDYSAIKDLPKAELLEIFLRFPLAFSDKLIVEMVFQGWKAIGRISWASVTRVGEYWPSDIFIEIATRAGSFLSDVKLILPAVLSANHAANFEDLKKSLLSVALHCANLDRLMISLGNPRLPRIVSEAFGQAYMGILMIILSKYRCLKYLSLRWIEPNPSFINVLPAEIEEIHLSGFFLSQPLNEGPVELSKFQNLQALTLFLFDIPEHQLEGIERLENLKVLNLHKCRVHPSNISNIVNLTRLEYLAIPDCGISDVTLSRILQNNKGLKELDISGNTEVTNKSIQYVCALEFLEVLRMQGLHQVTDMKFTGMTALRTLDCTGCSAIKDKSIQRLFAPSSVISELFISGCSVTIECLKTAIKWTSQTAKPLVIFVDENLYKQWEDIARQQFELYLQKDSDESKAGTSNRISRGFHVARYETPDEFWPSLNDWNDYHLVNDDHKWCHAHCQRIP